MNGLPFVDRQRETARLKRALDASRGSFICLYGRRRTGKSRLLREVLSSRRAVYYAGDQREAPLQRAAVAVAMNGQIAAFDRVRYPDWASLFDRWWREAPEGAVLALDEFPYMAAESPELPSLLQNRLDQSTRRLHLILCGSSQRMMQGLVLDGSAPLYGRAREIINLRPLPARWLSDALEIPVGLPLLHAYAVWGGVPWYWELAAAFPSTWQAVESLVLDPLGVLHQEPRRLLLDDLRDTVQASSLLALVGQGSRRMSEIAARMEKPATSLTRPMQRLLDLGLLHRDVPFGRSHRASRQTVYHVTEPFLTFWYRYVDPHRSRLEAGRVADVLKTVKETFSQHVGDTWESLARESVPRLDLASMTWNCASRWWGAGIDRIPLELDIVAESQDGEALLVGEAKLRASKAEVERIASGLSAKIGRTPFADRYKRIVTAVFVAEGSDLPPDTIDGSTVIEALA